MIYALLGLVLLAIIGAFLLSISSKRLIEKQISDLADSACPICSTIYGLQLAISARNTYLDACHKLQKENPHMRINFVRFWDVRCPVCKSLSEYHYEILKVKKKEAEQDAAANP